MLRRTFLACPALLAVPALAHADVPKVDDLAAAQRWIDQLQAARSASATGAWPLGAVLEHLAQSIEMSLDGYPRPYSAAFAFFDWRGRMSHGLDEPIPGAPALVAGADWRAPAERLRAAIRRFDAHTGPLRPHFAYGALDKAQYRRAHAMHIANHQDEVVRTA